MSAAAVDVAMPERVELMGMPLDVVTEAEALRLLVRRQEAGVGTWVITPNLDILRRFVRERGPGGVRELFGEADVFLGDGMPLVWASRMAKLGRSRRGLPERVPGSGLVFSVAAEAVRRGWRLYLLGGNPGAAEAAAKVLAEKYPGLVIAGTDCPAVGFEKDAAAMRAVEERLVVARADVVYVALGFPKQERVIRRLRKVLPGAMFLGVGISLSFISGEVKRAPRWMQRVGLEWVHRMVQEPGRLVKRYLWEDLPFALFRLGPHALRRRWGGGARRREGV